MQGWARCRGDLEVRLASSRYGIVMSLVHQAAPSFGAAHILVYQCEPDMLALLPIRPLVGSRLRKQG